MILAIDPWMGNARYFQLSWNLVNRGNAMGITALTEAADTMSTNMWQHGWKIEANIGLEGIFADHWKAFIQWLSQDSV